jgi:hypothetical protein
MHVFKGTYMYWYLYIYGNIRLSRMYMNGRTDSGFFDFCHSKKSVRARAVWGPSAGNESNWVINLTRHWESRISKIRFVILSVWLDLLPGWIYCQYWGLAVNKVHISGHLAMPINAPVIGIDSTFYFYLL